MPKIHQEWQVLPHGPLTALGNDLYTVEGELKMPLGESRRRMTVVRLRDGRLVIYSAMALDEPQMTRLLALGRPAYLIVPSSSHRLDIVPWKKRFADLKVVAPSGAREQVSKVAAVDATQADFNDPRVELSVVAGTGEQEFALMVQTESGKTLIVNDLIFNLPKLEGAGGVMLRLLGFGPGHPQMPKLVMLKLMKDKAAVRKQLESWAQVEGLQRIIPSHGRPIEAPRSTLLELAQALA
jgi:hypothetical protein